MIMLTQKMCCVNYKLLEGFNSINQAPLLSNVGHVVLLFGADQERPELSTNEHIWASGLVYCCEAQYGAELDVSAFTLIK